LDLYRDRIFTDGNLDIAPIYLRGGQLQKEDISPLFVYYLFYRVGCGHAVQRGPKIGIAELGHVRDYRYGHLLAMDINFIQNPQGVDIRVWGKLDK
jgi:hypothetical protein